MKLKNICDNLSIWCCIINYNDRKLIWENKTYETDSDVKNCISKEQYEKRRNEQIKWSYEQWLMNYHKLNVVKDMIEDINKLWKEKIKNKLWKLK